MFCLSSIRISYVDGLGKEPASPLFPAALGKPGKLSRRPLVGTDAADMLKRQLKSAIPEKTCLEPWGKAQAD
jgi:hypothetical protein